MIQYILDKDKAPIIFTELLSELHKEGPRNSLILEKISYFKEFHSELFAEYEQNIITMLGLFYKNPAPKNLYSFIMSQIGREHKEEFGSYLTPVQASVRRAINTNNYVSISAPTSAGKSYSIRDFIAENDGDAVIVVPSRALIAEYIGAMRRKFNGVKNVMITSFVDDVFKSRNLRKIYVLTPERAQDLFFNGISDNINVFFFDEAQISEDKSRGLIFDVLIHNVKLKYPKSKLIFAHPFVENPDAQLKKHNIDNDLSYSKTYGFGAVGKIFIQKHHNNKYYYFSPFYKNGHHIKHSIEYNGKFDDFAFDGTHSVLVFVSKSSIYSGKFLLEFKKYIDKYNNVEDQQATVLIEKISNLLGANNSDHRSLLVSLLYKGVVVHHGSVPLEVRFLIEDFIRLGFAKICFATSTLAQGVNMPFDIVWLNNMRILGDSEEERSLSFKNLIGRAGRLTDNPNFDYGYVFTENAMLLSRRLNDKFFLKETTVFDNPESISDSAIKEIVEAINKGSYDTEKRAPLSRVERLRSVDIIISCKSILDSVYENVTIKDSISGFDKRNKRNLISSNLLRIYECSIGRSLEDGENAIFNQAITIFLLSIQGYSFKEIVSIRYAHISNKTGNYAGVAKFIQAASKLPDIKLTKSYPLIKDDVSAKNVSYDAVVFDTYDYMDQVISFCLTDHFITAFKVYADIESDLRAEKFIELLRYGTNNPVYTLLMRYGFPSDLVSEISQYIFSISEENIEFNSDLKNAPEHIVDLVDWYLP